MRTGQARRRDANEKAICDALRRVGATIVRINAAGAPDMLVGFRGANTLMEIKSEHGLIRANQAAWRSGWAGQVVVVRTEEEALAAIGALR